MAFLLNTNISSLVAQQRLSYNTQNVQSSLEKLSSGLRINRASDDAAGLNISELLTAQTVGSKKALQNTQDGVSVLQIAEGGLSVIGNNMQRMRELAVQAANDTVSQTQRNAIAQEIRSLADDIQRIADDTTFNGISLLDGNAVNTLLQIGPNSALTTDTLDIASALASVAVDLSAPNGGLGIVDSGGSTQFASLNDIWDGVTSTMTSSQIAQNFLDDLDNAIVSAIQQRTVIGAFQNQLESVTENLTLSVENLSTSNSRIKDLDVAAESSALVQNQILQQASVSILSQANDIAQLTLSLLQG